ncbi:Sugar phosphatase YfbT [Sodalis glossinidius str. 'morsitans']|nr:HAD-IA family hydrolase [Sodalis glossinidius]CRL46264.1 Sugar phosphatase YfbT [Sodalis glossinidius str. 'morsitans']
MKLIKSKALLFDMDGTLVHSTHQVEFIWRHWCRINQIAPQQALSICHGVRSRDVIRRIAPHLPLEEQTAVLDGLEIEFTGKAREIQGAGRFLSSLGDAPWAVVTSASQRVARHRMTCCRLPLPAQMVGANEVSCGKPDAEPYRLGAKLLGVAPSDCLAFEDAPAGIHSALAAGCSVIQVGGAPQPGARIRSHIRDWRQIRFAKFEGGEILLELNLSP